ncbi:MAG: zinc transporter ZupT [Bacilli bacterium]
MNNITLGFGLTILAGLSTMLGTILIFLKKKNDKVIIGSLSFASGVMLSVSLIDLIPSSFNLLLTIFPFFPAIIYILIFITSGIIFSMLIDKYLPDNSNSNDKSLYRVGLISMLAIIIHNIPEGMATFIATNNNAVLGISLAIAIALHNIPEGISISVPIFYATNSRLKAIFYTFISSISEPLGAIITYLFLKPFINDRIMGFLFSLIAGIMIHISLYELIPASKKYKKQTFTLLWFILGIIFMVINHLIFRH